MNSYKNFKKLFNEDLVCFVKFNGQYSAILKNNDEYMNKITVKSPESQSYLEENINPYFYKMDFYNTKLIKTLRINENIIYIFLKLINFAWEQNNLIAYLLEQKIINIVKPSKININIFFENNYDNFKSLSFLFPKIEDKIFIKNIVFKYCFRTDSLFIDGEKIELIEFEFFIEKIKKESIICLNDILKIKYKEIEERINEDYR